MIDQPLSALVPALVIGVLCGAGGVLVPALIRSIPEPALQPDSPDSPAVGPGSTSVAKVPYAVLAASPGLRWGSALVAAVAGVLIGGGLGWTWQVVYLIPLVPIGVALGFIDLRTRLLPTKVILPSYALVIGGVLLCALVTGDLDDLVRAGAGLLIARGFFWLLWFIRPASMGFGDVRLSGVLGIALGYLGWGALLVGIYAGFLIGGVTGLGLAARRGVQAGYPFGPFMLLGALIGVVWGESLFSVLVG